MGSNYGVLLMHRIFMPATCKSDGVRNKQQGLQTVKDMVCHMYRTRRGVAADNFL